MVVCTTLMQNITLKNGASVDTLELDYDGSLTFKLKTNLEIPSIKFAKEFANSAEGDEKATKLMAVSELRNMFNSLYEVLSDNS